MVVHPDARFADCTDEQLRYLVAQALLRADPSKVRFVTRFEPGWQQSRAALLRLASLFDVDVDTLLQAGPHLRDPSPEREWVALDG